MSASLRTHQEVSMAIYELWNRAHGDLPREEGRPALRQIWNAKKQADKQEPWQAIRTSLREGHRLLVELGVASQIAGEIELLLARIPQE